MGVRILTLLALLALWAAPAWSMVANTTLGKLATGADAILVGKVRRVVEVSDPAMRMAEVEVLEWVKGDPRSKRIWFLAQGSWTCDISTAVEGERVLLFLRKAIVDLGLDAPAFGICWSGRGRMPLTEVAGATYAEFWSENVRPPADLPTISGDDPRYAFVRRAPLEAVLGFVRRRLKPLPIPKGEKAAAFARAVWKLDADTDIEGAEGAVDALREIGAESVPVLLGLLDDPANPRRDTVAEALGWIGDPGVAALVEGLRSEDPKRRRAAAFAFEWVGLLSFVDLEELAPKVLPGASHPDPEVRAGVIGALASWEDDVPLHAVVDALRDESLRVRRTAARTLVTLRHVFNYAYEPPFEEAERALLPLTAHEDVAVRREAWEALSHVAGPATLSAALKAQGDPDRVVRVTASLSLGRTGAAEATKRLTKLLESEDVWARRAAAHSFELGKVEAGIDALTKALHDPDKVVRGIAEDALKEIRKKGE